MKCKDCKFKWNTRECKSSCYECKYNVLEDSFICEKCGELAAYKDNKECNFEGLGDDKQ